MACIQVDAAAGEACCVFACDAVANVVAQSDAGMRAAVVERPFRIEKIKMPRVAPLLDGGRGYERFARGFEKRKPLGWIQRTILYQERSGVILTSRATSGSRARRTKGDLRGPGKVSTGTAGEACALPLRVG